MIEKTFYYDQIKPGTKCFITKVAHFCDGYYFHPYSTKIKPIACSDYNSSDDSIWHLYRLPNGKIVKKSLNKKEPNFLHVTIWDSFEEFFKMGHPLV